MKVSHIVNQPDIDIIIDFAQVLCSVKAMIQYYIIQCSAGAGMGQVLCLARGACYGVGGRTVHVILERRCASRLPLHE